MRIRHTIIGGLTLVIGITGAPVSGAAAGRTPAATAAPGAAAAKKTWKRTSDFNGDGYDDLAIGAPGGTVGGKEAAGYVTIVPGSRKGPVPAKKRVISQASAGVPGGAAKGKRFGETLAAADFNGDGYADLVVGTPRDYDVEDAIHRPGSLTIFFGGRKGLRRPYRILGVDNLGSAVTAADVDGNGRPEIVATEPSSNFGKVVRFTVAKKRFTAVRTADTAPCGSYAIAGGDVTGDGYDDVVAMYTQVGGSKSFALYAGSRSGLAPEALADHTWDGGADLALGDLNRDGRADLVIGRPVAARFAPDQSGEVFLFYGATTGVAEEPDRTITQASPGVPDAAEEYDQFGSAVAIGDLTGDGNPELVIGAQREGVGAVEGAGAVTVLRGSATGPAARKAQWFSRGTHGLAGRTRRNDQFGWLAMIRDVNGDHKGDLAVTAIGGHPDPAWPYYGDGWVTVLPGGRGGAVARKAKVISPKSVGAPVSAAQFGWSLGR